MKRLLSILFILFSAIVANGQKLTASAPAEVGMNQDFQVEWTVNADGNNFKLPPMPDFQLMGGPYQSTSFQMVNGRTSQSISLTYQFRPKHVGKCTIGPATVQVASGTISSNSLTINVVQGSANSGGQASRQPQQQQPRGGGQPQAQSGSDGQNNGDVFIKISLNKSNVMEGEAVLATYKLYARNVQLNQLMMSKAPAYNFFWSEMLPEEKNPQMTQEMYNGKKYAVALIRKVILYPQKSGTLTLDPMTVTVAGVKQVRSNDPFFGSFFPEYQQFSQDIKSTAYSIKVQSLPEAGKPAGFSGIVGKFQISAKATRNKLKENDALNYTVTVSGTGNFSQVEPFTLSMGPEWDTYDPKTSDKLDKEEDRISGYKTFDYTMVPKVAGDYKIPAIHFSYFDINSHRYVTLNTNDIPVTVEKGSGNNGNASVSTLNKQEVSLLGQDIRYIKSKPGTFSDAGSYFYGSAGFVGLAITPFLAFIGLVVYKRRRAEENLDVTLRRRQKATGVARKHLKTANLLMQKKDAIAFYTEVLMALYGYVHDKTGLEMAETSRESIQEMLSSKNIHETEISSFLQIVDQCEFAKYAPVAVQMDMEPVYNQTLSLISTLEGQLK